MWSEESVVFFNILSSICALRHNAVHLFDILTSESGPNVVIFSQLDFEMCFVPQRRALFWTSKRAIVLRTWGVASKCASHHCKFWSLIRPDGCVPAALSSLLFDPPELQNIGKSQYFATFLPLCTLYSSFFWLVLFSDFFSFSFLFSVSSHLCCFICHLSIIFVGSLASKFHSIISSYPSNFQPFKDCRLLRHLWPLPGRPSEASTSSRGGIRRLHQGVFSLFCPVLSRLFSLPGMTIGAVDWLKWTSCCR